LIIKTIVTFEENDFCEIMPTGAEDRACRLFLLLVKRADK
jgi:hypothetical protein